MQFLQDLIDFYETLSPESLPRLAEFYAPDARFKDPFNDVQGLPAIIGIFRHMYAQVDAPRFHVLERFVGDDQAMLLWEFSWQPRSAWGGGGRWSFRGSTHLRLTAGRVSEHRDYWDPGEELLLKLPILGCLWRGFRRLLAA
ncbi:nuclear transport factor 2 family protein [Dechloromonas sp. ZY10]|uniref:nuclear transport factor 2 family protein n=1 Tax=Dechloromonas aquae TaxID=2664436 RepID=UPI003526FADB